MHGLFAKRGISVELRAYVVAKDSALLASVRKTSLHSVASSFRWKILVRNGPQHLPATKEGHPTLALVNALRLAHDDARDTVL